MSATLFPLVPLFFVLLFVFGAFMLDRLRQQRRAEALATWASGMDYTYTAGPTRAADAEFARPMQRLPVFNRGRDRRVRNVIEGRTTESARTVVFDYLYVTGSGRDSRRIYQTLAGFEVDATEVPDFELHPENVFSRIAQVFGSKDIDFDSAPEFSRQYVLKGDDEVGIRQVFERQAVPYLAEHTGWSVEKSGRWIAVYHAGRIVKPDAMPAFLDDTRTVVRTILFR
jgi:hypothetical protein